LPGPAPTPQVFGFFINFLPGRKVRLSCDRDRTILSQVEIRRNRPFQTCDQLVSHFFQRGKEVVCMTMSASFGDKISSALPETFSTPHGRVAGLPRLRPRSRPTFCRIGNQLPRQFPNRSFFPKVTWANGSAKWAQFHTESRRYLLFSPKISVFANR